MKKVIIFTIVTMTAVLMLTAASFGQRRMGPYDGYQGRRATSVWAERPVMREYRRVYRDGFDRDYSPSYRQIRREREMEMWRMRRLQLEMEARRAARIDRAIREARVRDFIYTRRVRDRYRY